MKEAKDRIKEKMEEVEKLLAELDTIVPSSFEVYLEDYKSRAACERYAERIIEGIVDVAYLLVREKKLESPEDDSHVFALLAEASLISLALSKKLREAKGMRNVLAHEYGSVDDHIVFSALGGELQQDSALFIQLVRDQL